MPRNFGLTEAAKNERRRTIDPRHEEPPAGDWPNVGFEPLDAATPEQHYVVDIMLVFGVVVILIAFGIYVFVG